MARHVSHIGVHDHGFNNLSTYGKLHRLMREGRIPHDPWEERFYALALKVSGAVQASRWTALPGNLGYIYSFNGPHSLFIAYFSVCEVSIQDFLRYSKQGEDADIFTSLSTEKPEYFQALRGFQPTTQF